MLRRIDKSYFALYRDEISASNLRMLQSISLFGVFAGVLSLAFGILLPSPWNSIPVYLIWIATNLLFYELCRHQAQPLCRRATIWLYTYMGVMMLSAIVNGTVLYPTNVTATVVGFFAIAPFLMIDRPLRFAVFQSIACVCLCVFSLAYKPFAVAIFDCSNAVGFSLLACSINYTLIGIKLRELSNHAALIAERDTDGLTGISTRQAVEKRIRAYLMQSEEEATLWILDIDYFKNLNDTLGHLWGDHMLIDFAQTIRASFRPTDYVARLGGDEFLVFVTGDSSPIVIREQANRLLSVLHKTVSDGERACTVTASIGIARYTGKETFEILYTQADTALYRVKNEGRNDFRIF